MEHVSEVVKSINSQIMETLPQEIADRIFDEILQENPQDLYRARLVSRTWKNIIDEYSPRLFRVWCKKCLDEIPESHRDDFVKTRYPKFASWEDYCSSEFASSMPHIARDIYLSWKEFPNLIGHLHSTEISSGDIFNSLNSYAVNDKYFAANFSMAGRDEIVRIYSINDPTQLIREYRISCRKMEFYAVNNQVFIVLKKRKDCDKREEGKRIFLGEFLVNDYLVQCNLPAVDKLTVPYMKYTITKNQWFTFCNYFNTFQHLSLTSNGLEVSTVIQLLPRKSCNEFKIIKKIQICNSKLLVMATYFDEYSKVTMKAIYIYQITRQPDDKLLFTDPKIYHESTATDLTDITINFDNIPSQNIFCHRYLQKLERLMKKFLRGKTNIFSVTAYNYHVMILCKVALPRASDRFIVFRGNLRQLMDYDEKNTDLSSKFTVINIKQASRFRRFFPSEPVRVIHTQFGPKFLVVTCEDALIIDFIPQTSFSNE